MQQIEVQNKKLLSPAQIKKLKKAKRLPKLKKERVELLSGNFEINEILKDLLENYQDSMSGRYKIFHPAFEYLTKLFGHVEEKDNYLKLKALVDALNEEKDKKDKDKKDNKKAK